MSTDTNTRGPSRRLAFGVKVLIALQILNAAATVFSLVVNTTTHFDPLPEALQRDEMQLLIDGLYALLGLFIAYGLFQMRYWAWIAIMLWSGTRMASNLVSYFENDPEYIAMLRDVVIVFYLNQRDVRQIFAPQQPEPVILRGPDDD